MPPLPWFKYYPNDFFNDRYVARMTLEEIGMYHLMLKWAWNEEPPGTLPANISELSKILGYRPQVVRRLLGGVLGNCWKTHTKLGENPEKTYQFDKSFREVLLEKTPGFWPDRIYNPRLVKEAQKQQDISDGGRKGANITNAAYPTAKASAYAPAISESDSESEKEKPTPPKGEPGKWIDKFNEITGSNYRKGEKYLRLIKSRITEGFTLKDAEDVIRAKLAEWGTDDKMSKNVRPQTLFSGNFESYLHHARNGHGTGSVDLAEINSYTASLLSKQPNLSDDTLYRAIKSRSGEGAADAWRKQHAQKNVNAT